MPTDAECQKSGYEYSPGGSERHQSLRTTGLVDLKLNYQKNAVYYYNYHNNYLPW